MFLRAGREAGAVEAKVWSDAYDSSLILYVPPMIDSRLREQVARQVRALPDKAYGTVFSTSARPAPASPLPVHLAAAQDCETSRLVAFSCKGRGWCPSCTNRRAVETGVRLAALLPHVGHRQWTLP